MSILNENCSIKIKDVGYMEWDKASVTVAARPIHALSLRLWGGAEFVCNGQAASTNKNDVFYMPAGCLYRADYNERNEILYIHFESDLTSKMENFKFDNPDIIEGLFRKIYNIWQKGEEGYYFSALSVMGEILKNIVVQQMSGSKDETVKAFENAVEYMEENYLSYDFSVEKMVSVACMSNTYFRKLFSERYGTTPLKFVLSKRVGYAEKLLSTGKHSIEEVAEMSGFSDSKYFCRAMKKEYGVPPSKLYQHKA